MRRAFLSAIALFVSGFGCGDQPRAAGWVYYQADHDGVTQVHRVRAAGGPSEMVTAGPEGAYVYGATPQGARLVLVRGREGRFDLWTAAPDGSRPRRLTRSEGFDWHPSLAPRGEHVLFESSRRSFRDLYQVSLSGGEVARLTNDREGNFDGAWSPDGRRVAFASSRHGQLDLFVMAADGTMQRRLTSHPGDSIRPAWAGPDRIVFISGRDDSDQLFSVRPDGRELRKLTEGPGHIERFEVSPEGHRVAYARRVGARSKVHVLDLHRGSTVVISRDADDDRDPNWSPSGRWLTFASGTGGRSNIFVATPDGRRRRALTQELTGAWRPRWLAIQEGRIP